MGRSLVEFPANSHSRLVSFAAVIIHATLLPTSRDEPCVTTLITAANETNSRQLRRLAVAVIGQSDFIWFYQEETTACELAVLT